MSSYHILVWYDVYEGIYSRPYAVHFLTPSKLTPHYAFTRASELLDKYFPSWRDEGIKQRYLGIEHLPIKLTSSYSMIVRYWSNANYDYYCREVKYYTTPDIPSSIQKSLEQFRLSRLTLDYDWEFDLPNIYRVLEDYPDARIIKTYRGWHIIIEKKYDSFEKQLEERRKYGDDGSRLAIDEQYLKNNLGFLVNVLFNEKYWFKDSKLMYHRHHPISKSQLPPAKYSATISYKLPNVSIDLGGIGRITIEDNLVKAELKCTEEKFKELVQSIEDNFWEYQLIEEAEDIKDKIINAYAKIKPSIVPIIKQCDIKYTDGIAVIHVPDKYSAFIGSLIGRAGNVIKKVEEEVGFRIHISSKPMEEREELKNRLDQLLKALL